MRDDLSAEEAILGSHIAFNVNEAKDPLWYLMSQHEGGQPAHGMSYQVERLYAKVFESG